MRGWAAVALLLAAGPAAAASFSASSRGTTAAEFLNMGAGARAAAMGGASCAAVDDASAVYWNPAAMTLLPHHSGTLMHAAGLNSNSYEFGSYVQNEGEMGAFGMGVQYFTPGRLVRTNEAGSYLENLVPYDMAVSWSYAHEFRGFSFGANAKIVDSKIINSGSAGALDVGALSPDLFDRRLRLAFTATNLGEDAIVYDQAGAKLPMTLRAGAAWRASPELQLSSDAVFPRSDDPHLTIGAEYLVSRGGPWAFLARGGFDTATLGSVDGFTAVSFGFGVESRGASVDYAFAPLGGLGQIHRLSLSFGF